ncbi:MAG TPA: hypothetical protein VGL82_07525 [Bryobacteraceae bacterium]
MTVPGKLQTIGGVLVFTFALAITAGSAKADVYDFNYQGIAGTNYANVFGSGVITTGADLGDGYVAITSITGITELGTITGMVAGSATPPSYAACCNYDYDNAFLPTNLSNPFSGTGGVLFNAGGTLVNLFGDTTSGGVSANTYEFSYAEESIGGGPSYGGTQISFTALDVSEPSFVGADSVATPEPGFVGAVVLCMSGLLVVAIRRRKNA